MQKKPQVSIILTRYREPNWLLFQTMESLARQRQISAEVLLLDQIDDEETKKESARLNSEAIEFKYEPILPKGLSNARNCGVRKASSQYVLFIDSDAIADEHWASELCHTLSGENVAVAGSKIVPEWHGKRPLMARVGIIREHYSLLDYGNHEIDASKVVGAGFGINRVILGAEAHFDENLGRRDGLLFGGEETDLCRRAINGGLRVRYNGRSVLRHQILSNRLTNRWLIKRLYYAGQSRALRSGQLAPTHVMSLWDHLALVIVLPIYGIGYLRARHFMSRRREGNRP